MKEKMYTLDGNKATRTKADFYEREDDLQKLIADIPQLVLGELQSDAKDIRLVTREKSVSDDGSDIARYSLDILFLTDTGIPILVEVKRSVDTRSKREVVAQMIDYACRVHSWNVQKLRVLTQANNKELPEAYTTDEYWESVEQNIKTEQFTMVFLADKISKDLESMICFLDRCMDSISVIGIEVNTYTSGGQRTATTKFIGNKERTVTKAAFVSSPWDINSLADRFAAIDGMYGVIFKDIVSHFSNKGMQIACGKGKKLPSCAIKLGNLSFLKMQIWSNNQNSGTSTYVEFNTAALAKASGRSEDELKEIVSYISDEKKLYSTAHHIYVNFKLLSQDRKLEEFYKVCDTVIQMVQ